MEEAAAYQQLIEAKPTDVNAGFVMEEIKSTVALPLEQLGRE